MFTLWNLRCGACQLTSPPDKMNVEIGHSEIHIRNLFSTVLKDYWELRAVVGTVEKLCSWTFTRKQHFSFLKRPWSWKNRKTEQLGLENTTLSEQHLAKSDPKCQISRFWLDAPAPKSKCVETKYSLTTLPFLVQISRDMTFAMKKVGNVSAYPGHPLICEPIRPLAVNKRASSKKRS